MDQTRQKRADRLKVARDRCSSLIFRGLLTHLARGQRDRIK
jgi:hypothetical protein